MAQNEPDDMDTSDLGEIHQTPLLDSPPEFLAGSSGIGSNTGPVVQTQPQPSSVLLVKRTNDTVQEDLYTAGGFQASAAPKKMTTSDVQQDLYMAYGLQYSAAPIKTDEKVDQPMEGDPDMLTPSAPPLPTSDVQEDLYTADGFQASAAPKKMTTSDTAYSKKMNVGNDQINEPMSSPASLEKYVEGRTPKEETEGDVHAIVDCQWKGEEKSKHVLQKALQSWFNTSKDLDFKDKSCDVKSFSSDGRALIKIKPASVIEALLKLGETELTTKDGKTATIKFCSTPVLDPGTPTPDSHLMVVPSTLPPATQDVKIPTEGWSGGAATGGQEMTSYPIPFFHYLYMSQAYKEKIKRIERDNGVQIKPEVKVSIEVDQRAGTPDLSKACREFTDLVQSCLGVYDSCTFPLKNADPGDWTATLKTLQREEAKVVLTASSEECTVWGPKESFAALPKSLTKPQNTPGNNDIFPSASAWGSPDTSQKIGLNIQDPLVSNGITMDEIHWKLMMVSSNNEIVNIEDKFGVKLENKISQGRVKVRANGVEAAALKSHALRALLQLYQKVATSTMSCSLMAPDKAKVVEDKLKEMYSQYPVIGTRENYDSLRLIGLPENLGPAVNELETLVGTVFKEDDKQRLGYSRYHRSSVGATSMGGRATAGGATGENSDENCPICIDTFINKEKLKCGHEFCKECLKSSRDSMGDICPVCKAVFGKVEGDQPEGNMTWNTTQYCLPGFSGCGTITINYSIPNGTQMKKHPNPGKHYYGVQRTAYLPDNKEGREVLQLLKRAFDQKLTFTVGTSRTTGADDVVTWNDIHHKTNMHGDAACFGYPDPNYLSRVKEELKAKGIE